MNAKSLTKLLVVKEICCWLPLWLNGRKTRNQLSVISMHHHTKSIGKPLLRYSGCLFFSRWRPYAILDLSYTSL